MVANCGYGAILSRGAISSGVTHASQTVAGDAFTSVSMLIFIFAPYYSILATNVKGDSRAVVR
jgi:hypothetical protein